VFSAITFATNIPSVREAFKKRDFSNFGKVMESFSIYFGPLFESFLEKKNFWL